MNGSWQLELEQLMRPLLDGGGQPTDQDRLDQLLSENPDALQTYVALMQIDSILRWQSGRDASDAGRNGAGLFERGLPTETCPLPAPDISVPMPDVHISPLSSPPAGFDWLVSYGVAAVLVTVALLSARAYKVTHVLPTTPDMANSRLNQESPMPAFVGKITGMKDCRWKKGGMWTVVGASVPLGRKYSLSSGLMEITYNSGAHVILEGPCEYTVDSSAGGYLGRGKLTARIEKRRERSEERGERRDRQATSAASTKPRAANPQPPAPNPQPPTSPLSTLHSPLFTISTPTAIVTDLGTEFGVEVDESGKMASHVYRGRIEVKAISDAKDNRPIQLDAGESIEVGHGAKPLVKNNSGSPRSASFVRHVPKRVQIETFNTGKTIDEGTQDPRWRLVARTDDPDFEPRPVAVTRLSQRYALPNDPEKSQWITPIGNPTVSNRVIYTFRTTFILKRMATKTAVLCGRFLVDDHVNAIRINGHNLKVAPHRWGWPFVSWCWFQASDGFIDGTNILEIDVLNDDPNHPQLAASTMALRVEYEVTCYESLAPTGGRTDGKPAREDSHTKKDNHPDKPQSSRRRNGNRQKGGA